MMQTGFGLRRRLNVDVEETMVVKFEVFLNIRAFIYRSENICTGLFVFSIDENLK